MDFSESGNSDDYIGSGWGPSEPTHRWTVGSESTISLPLPEGAVDIALFIDILPWRDEYILPSQTIMLAINDRLFVTIDVSDHRALAFPLSEKYTQLKTLNLTFHHLHAFTARPQSGLDRNGRALGLLVTRIRLFQLPASRRPVETRFCFKGKVDDGSMKAVVRDAISYDCKELAMHFESIGHNCEFGLVQRKFGAEPQSLLRFVMMVTHELVGGILKGFDGVGDPSKTRVFMSEPPEAEFKVHDEKYYLWYATGKTELDTTQDRLHAEQCRRLSFLQRKFIEDLHEGHKIYVVTRAEMLTEPESLALYCAINTYGPNTLLWTVHGDDSRAGQVDRIRPGFLRGHLGKVNDIYYAEWEPWLSVLANAYLLSHSGD